MDLRPLMNMISMSKISFCFHAETSFQRPMNSWRNELIDLKATKNDVGKLSRGFLTEKNSLHACLLEKRKARNEHWCACGEDVGFSWNASDTQPCRATARNKTMLQKIMDTPTVAPLPHGKLHDLTTVSAGSPMQQITAGRVEPA